MSDEQQDRDQHQRAEHRRAPHARGRREHDHGGQPGRDDDPHLLDGHRHRDHWENTSHTRRIRVGDVGVGHPLLERPQARADDEALPGANRDDDLAPLRRLGGRDDASVLARRARDLVALEVGERAVAALEQPDPVGGGEQVDLAAGEGVDRRPEDVVGRLAARPHQQAVPRLHVAPQRPCPEREDAPAPGHVAPQARGEPRLDPARVAGYDDAAVAVQIALVAARQPVVGLEVVAPAGAVEQAQERALVAREPGRLAGAGERARDADRAAGLERVGQAVAVVVGLVAALPRDQREGPPAPSGGRVR